MKLKENTQLKDIMTTEVEVISPQDTLRDAAQKMRVHNVGFLPVCEDDQVLGAITDRDITVRATADGVNPDKPIKEFITTPIISCFDDDDIEKAANLMEEHQIRRVVILSRNDQHLAGVISLGDVAVISGKDTSAGVLQNVSEQKS